MKRLPNGKRELLIPINVTVELEPSGLQVIRRFSANIPAGFQTDYASGPAQLVVRFSRVDIAGVVHDWMYSMQHDRRLADEVFYAVAITGQHCANKLQARTCWLALRAFGWIAYARHGRDIANR